MVKKDLITAIIGTFCLTVTLFAVLPTRSQSPFLYDPWADINDDGKIDMKDIGYLARLFGTTGEAINKTALLLELQVRMDTLNATVMALEELIGQSQNCQVLTGTGTGVGIVEANFSQAFPNGTTPKVFVMAVLKADDAGSGLKRGMCVYPELISVTNTWFAVLLKEDVGGANLLTATADIYYIAIGTQGVGTKHCAGTETLVTIGEQITITFPFNFTTPPQLSVVVFVQTGMHAGKVCYIQSMSIGTASATLDLQAWTGAAYEDIGDSESVQVSYTAVETP